MYTVLQTRVIKPVVQIQTALESTKHDSVLMSFVSISSGCLISLIEIELNKTPFESPKIQQRDDDTVAQICKLLLTATALILIPL